MTLSNIQKNSLSEEERMYWVWNSILKFDNIPRQISLQPLSDLEVFISVLSGSRCLVSIKRVLLIEKSEEPSPGKLFVLPEKHYITFIDSVICQKAEEENPFVVLYFLELNKPNRILSWVLDLNYISQYEKFFENFLVL